MQAEIRKMEERRVLDFVRTRLADFPKGRVIASESPDFIIVTRHFKVGIEITRWFVPDEEPASGRTKFLLSDLNNLIAQKEALLPFYRKQLLHSCHLIVSLETNNESLANHLRVKLMHTVMSSAFNRLFVTSVQFKWMLELQICRNS